MFFNDLTGEQRRQLIDVQQVYAAWEEADYLHRRRFAGSMRWGPRNGTDYLLRKIGQHESSLGPRSTETEVMYNAFINGREANSAKFKSLTARLDQMAPVNKAMGLGRIPRIAAQILRQCHEKNLLGQQLFVVGTNALFAYEVMAGIRFESGLIASGDIDLLYDSRSRLSLAVKEELRDAGLIGLLQKVDKSFSGAAKNYSVSNRDGYAVDLIRPQGRDVMRDKKSGALTDFPDDMEGAEIAGLEWLIHSKKIDAVVVDDAGYPLRMVVVDPRIFALHKMWISERPERSRVKNIRDRQQARAIGMVAGVYLNMAWDDASLSVPPELRGYIPALSSSV